MRVCEDCGLWHGSQSTCPRCFDFMSIGGGGDGVKEEGYVLGTGPPVQVGHDVVPVSKLWLLRLPVVLNILAEGVDEAEELSSHWGKLDKRGQLLIGAVGRQVTWGKDSFGAIFIWISSAISFDFLGN